MKRAREHGRPVPPGTPPPPPGTPPPFGEAVPLEWIVVEPGFNLRTSGCSPEDLDTLGRALQTGGQIQPAIGDRLVSGQIRLVDGHRRFFAAQRAGLSTLWVVECDQKAPEIERYIQNASANLARRELTVPERAITFERLGRVWQAALPEVPSSKIDVMIALRCGVSRQQVGQYRRFVQKLHPDVVAAWKAAPETVPVKWLDQVVKLAHPEQLKALALLRMAKAETEPAQDENGRGPKVPKGRPTRKRLETTLALLRSRDTTGYAAHLSAEYVQGAILGLELALGKKRLDPQGLEILVLRPSDGRTMEDGPKEVSRAPARGEARPEVPANDSKPGAPEVLAPEDEVPEWDGAVAES